MKKKKTTNKEKEFVEKELTKLMQMTLMLENELYCMGSKEIKIN